MSNDVIVKLSRTPKGKVQLTIGDNPAYENVKLRWNLPVSEKGKYLSFLNDKNEEVYLLKDPSILDNDSKKILEQELDSTYLTTRIEKVLSATSDFGTICFCVITNRGQKQFVIRNHEENIKPQEDNRIMITDIDENVYFIEDFNAMDEHSKSIMHRIL